MNETVFLTLSGIVASGIFAQWLAWRTNIPAILFLLLLGIVAGPITGILDPDALFGDLLFPMVSLAVAVILFEGSLTLRFAEVRGLSHVIWRLVSVGMLITWAVASGAAYLFVDLSPGLAALFGALVVVTGPTVIVPLLRSVRPKRAIATILRWEGIVIDPIGALLAVLVFEFLVMSARAQGAPWTDILWLFAKVVAAGALLGVVGGQFLGQLLRRHLLPEYLINAVVLALVVTVFTLSNVLAHESGLLAVTVMGIRLANMRGVPLDNVLDFKETLTILFISVLFIVLAARIDFATMGAVGFGALLVLAAIQFVAQPLKVWVSAIGSPLRWQEKLLIAWIGPRGIVAAAISGLFAFRLQAEGIAGAETIVPLTFIVIVGTVLIASLTAAPLARRLGVAEPEPKGVLIVGAHAFARALAQVLVKLGYRVILADTDYLAIRQARMAGLETFFGNPVSEAADRKLDLSDINFLLALSPSPELNALAVLRYEREFGAGNVFVLQTEGERSGSAKARLTEEVLGRRLFGETVTLEQLLSWVEGGGKISTTKLTETFDWAAYQKRLGTRGAVLLTVTPSGLLKVVDDHFALKPGAGWTVVALLASEAVTALDEVASTTPPADPHTAAPAPSA
jgi:NhaP-type Na+/H+ or K+/H+ antiporter